MADSAGGAFDALRQEVQAIEKNLSTLMQRFGEQEQELETLSRIVMELSAGRRELQDLAAKLSAAQPARRAVEATPVIITPAMREVLRAIHTGHPEAAKQALAAIPAEERNAQPAVLALVAAALCIARGDQKNAETALAKARQLTTDVRLLRLVELTAAKLTAPAG